MTRRELSKSRSARVSVAMSHVPCPECKGPMNVWIAMDGSGYKCESEECGFFQINRWPAR